MEQWFILFIMNDCNMFYGNPCKTTCLLLLLMLFIVEYSQYRNLS